MGDAISKDLDKLEDMVASGEIETFALFTRMAQLVRSAQALQSGEPVALERVEARLEIVHDEVSVVIEPDPEGSLVYYDNVVRAMQATPQPVVPEGYAEMLEHGSPYVIQKSGMYYAHGNKGYVSRVLLAELYTKEYAESHCKVAQECRAMPVTDLITGADEVQEYIDRLLVMKAALLSAGKGGERDETQRAAENVDRPVQRL